MLYKPFIKNTDSEPFTFEATKRDSMEQLQTKRINLNWE